MRIIPGVCHWFGYRWHGAEIKAGKGIRKMADGPRRRKIIAEKAREIYFNEPMGVNAGQEWEDCAAKIEELFSLGENSFASLELLLRGMCVMAWTATETLLHDLLFGSIEANGLRSGAKGKPGVKAREGYLFWFKHQYNDPAITTAINADELHALGAIRHAVAHRAAKMDDLFIKDVLGDPTKARPGSKILQARYPSPNEGASLELDGVFVHALIDGAMKACFRLLDLVNKWETT